MIRSVKRIPDHLVNSLRIEYYVWGKSINQMITEEPELYGQYPKETIRRAILALGPYKNVKDDVYGPKKETRDHANTKDGIYIGRREYYAKLQELRESHDMWQVHLHKEAEWERRKDRRKQAKGINPNDPYIPGN